MAEAEKGKSYRAIGRERRVCRMAIQRRHVAYRLPPNPEKVIINSINQFVCCP